MAFKSKSISWLLIAFALASIVCLQTQAKPKNIIFILSDDHRHDFMSFLPAAPDFLETPHLDSLAANGLHFENMFVATSLCSPSRASILTGQYMHHHRVVDNQRPVPEGTRFFAQDLQTAGVTTAYIGKWHMGHEDDTPRPGFDHWVSFKGQGTYQDPTLNINGERKNFKGYNADVLADQTIDWLKTRSDQPNEPFFLYLGFKAVHYPFAPAKRNDRRYAEKKIQYPDTMANTERNYLTQPRWVKDRRYSIHGIDHMQTGPFDNDPVPDFDEFFHNYCETVHSLDENIGKVLNYLGESGLEDDTMVIYTSDNGFHLGEHGFYDKRDAFETSIRVPLIISAPGWLPKGKTRSEMIQNIDFAPTILDFYQAEPETPPKFDGQSFFGLLEGKTIPWRKHILYEYHWEWNFPATPSLFAIRTPQHKYVYYHGTWDRDSFHDLESDPAERHNLIDVPSYQDKIATLKKQLFDEFEASGGFNLPVRRPEGERLGQRKLRR